MTLLLFAIDFHEKVSMEAGFENCGEIMNLSKFEIVARTHTRLSYSFPRLMGFYFELMMSMNLGFQNNMILGL